VGPLPTKHSRFEGFPPLHNPEQQSIPSRQDSPTAAPQLVGAFVGGGVGVLVGESVTGESVGDGVTGAEVGGGVGTFVGKGLVGGLVGDGVTGASVGGGVGGGVGSGVVSCPADT